MSTRTYKSSETNVRLFFGFRARARRFFLIFGIDYTSGNFDTLLEAMIKEDKQKSDSKKRRRLTIITSSCGRNSSHNYSFLF